MDLENPNPDQYKWLLETLPATAFALILAIDCESLTAAATER